MSTRSVAGTTSRLARSAAAYACRRGVADWRKWRERLVATRRARSKDSAAARKPTRVACCQISWWVRRHRVSALRFHAIADLPLSPMASGQPRRHLLDGAADR